MNKENFDEILNKNIKELKEVPLSVEDKIQKAYQKLDESEGKVMKFNFNNVMKFNYGKMVGIAASFATAIFLIGNGIAYAMGNDNIYTWILERIGIQEAYEEIAENVNLTQESDEVKITLDKVGYDEKLLVISYKIQSDGLYNKVLDESARENERNKMDTLRDFYLGTAMKLYDEKGFMKLYDWTSIDLMLNKEYPKALEEFMNGIEPNEEEFNLYTFCDFVTENEMEYCQILDISNYNLGEEINLDVYIIGGLIGLDCDVDEKFSGDWSFSARKIKKGGSELEEYKNQLAKVNFEVEEKYNAYYNRYTNTSVVDYDSPMIIVNDENNIGQIVIDEVGMSTIGSLLHISTNYEYNNITEAYLAPYYAIDIVDKNGNVIVEKEIAENDVFCLARRLDVNEEYEMIVYKDYWWIDVSRSGEYEKVATTTFKIN